MSSAVAAAAIPPSEVARAALAERASRGSSEVARPRGAPAPVSEQDRISSVDTLRGFALLGILPINMVAFALPMAAYVTPMNDAVNAYRGPFQGIFAAAWLVPHFVCELKMMTIFSLLFGAGLVLLDRQAARRQHDGATRFAGLYYRRLLVLALIGLVHGFGIWFGDILVYYALAGALLYPLRNLKARTLIVAGLVLVAAQVGLNRFEGLTVAEARAAALQADQVAADGGTLTTAQEEAREEWASIVADNDPTAADVSQEIARVRRSAASAWRRNTEIMVYNLSSLELAFWLARALGAMLVGMGLMKLGVLSAQRSSRFYAALAGVGYGLGGPIVALGAWQLASHRFEPVFVTLVGRQYNFVGSWLVAVGHVGLVMLVCKHGQLRWLTTRLAAVGRMALTNYLAQSILCVALFSGCGLGLFARLSHVELLLLTLVIWAAQLAWSPRWLSRFRWGPVEWLWRSATYGRWEPLTAER